MSKVKIEFEVGNKFMAELIARILKYQLRELKKQYPVMQEIKVFVE